MADISTEEIIATSNALLKWFKVIEGEMFHVKSYHLSHKVGYIYPMVISSELPMGKM